MTKSIKALAALAAVAGATLMASLPASADRTPIGNAGYAFVPEGQFTGLPPWARSAFAPKD